MKYRLIISIGLLACASGIAQMAGAANPPGTTAAKVNQAAKPASAKPGAGTQARTAPGKAYSGGVQVAVGDINGDGKADAAKTTPPGGPATPAKAMSLNFEEIKMTAKGKKPDTTQTTNSQSTTPRPPSKELDKASPKLAE